MSTNKTDKINAQTPRKLVGARYLRDGNQESAIVTGNATPNAQKSNEYEVIDCIVDEMNTKYEPHVPSDIATVPNHAARFPQGPHEIIPSSGKVITPA
jgi:hypothetical protein